jgi:hypothetical protein
MAKVNAKLFALKYKLLKKLNASIEKDKEAIKNGAEITFKDYCKIQLVECQRASYTKEAQKILDEYAQEIGLAKAVTTYTRIDIDNIPTEIDDKVEQIFTTLEDSNDKDIKRVASKVANIK